MSRTLPAGLSTNLGAAAGAKPVVLLEIDFSTGTAYLSDREILVGTRRYLGLVTGWGDLAQAMGAGFDAENPVVSELRVEVFNGRYRDALDAWHEPFSDHFKDARFEGSAARLYIWEADAAAADKFELFRGVVMESGAGVEYTPERCVFDITDMTTKLDRPVGALITTSAWPQADPDSIGLYQNIVYGAAEKVPCPCVSSGAVSTLTAALYATTTGVYVTDTTGFTTGQAKIGAEIVNVLAVYSTYLYVARGQAGTQATTHDIGEACWQYNRPAWFLVAAHPVYSIGNVYVDGVKQIGGDFTKYTDYSGTMNDGVYHSHVAAVKFNSRPTLAKSVDIEVRTSAEFDFDIWRERAESMTMGFGSFPGNDHWEWASTGVLRRRMIFDDLNPLNGWTEFTIPRYSGKRIFEVAGSIEVDSTGGSFPISQFYRAFAFVPERSGLHYVQVKVGSERTGYMRYLKVYGPAAAFDINNLPAELSYVGAGTSPAGSVHPFKTAWVQVNLSAYNTYWFVVVAYGTAPNYQVELEFSGYVEGPSLEADKGYYVYSHNKAVASSQFGNGTVVSNQVKSIYLDNAAVNNKAIAYLVELFASNITGDVYVENWKIAWEDGNPDYLSGGLRRFILPIAPEKFNQRNGYLNIDASQGSITLYRSAVYHPPAEAARTIYAQSKVLSVSWNAWANLNTELREKLMESLPAVFRAGGDYQVDYTIEVESELGGNSVADVQIGAVSADVSGYQDDAGGTYTGSGNALIQRPDHVRRHFLQALAGVSPSYIDSSSFATAGASYAAKGYLFAGCIPGGRTYLQVLRDLDEQSRSVTWWEAGKAYLRFQQTFAEWGTPSVAASLTAAQIFSVKARHTAPKDVVNYFPVYYNLDPAAGDDAAAYEGLVEAQHGPSVGHWGRRSPKSPLLAYLVRSASMAQDLANAYIAFKANIRKFYEVEVMLDQLALTYYDVVTVTYPFDHLDGPWAVVKAAKQRPGSVGELPGITLSLEEWPHNTYRELIAETLRVVDRLGSGQELKETIADGIIITPALAAQIVLEQAEELALEDELAGVGDFHKTQAETLSLVESMKWNGAFQAAAEALGIADYVGQVIQGSFGADFFGTSPFGAPVDVLTGGQDTVGITEGLSYWLEKIISEAGGFGWSPFGVTEFGLAANIRVRDEVTGELS